MIFNDTLPEGYGAFDDDQLYGREEDTGEREIELKKIDNIKFDQAFIDLEKAKNDFFNSIAIIVKDYDENHKLPKNE